MIGFAGALSVYFGLAVSAGFNDCGAREVAQRPRDARAIAASAVVVRLAVAVVAFLALASAAWLFDKLATVRMVVELTGTLVLLPFARHLVGLQGARGERALRCGSDTRATALRRSGRASGTFLGDLSAALFLAIPLLGLGRIRTDVSEGLALLRSSGFLVLARLLRTVVFSFDVVLIGLVLGEHQVGLYTAAYRVCLVLLAVAIALHASYLPALTRASFQSTRDVARVAERAVQLAATVAAPLLVGAMLLAAPLLTALFGPDYAAGAMAFRLILLSVAFIFIGGAVHNVFLISHRLRTEMGVVGVAAGTNVGLNLVLTPRFGLVAAGGITACSEGLILLLGLLLLRRAAMPLTLRPVLRPVLAAGVMGTAVYAVEQRGSLAQSVAVGVITYAIALAGLSGVPEDAKPYLRKLARRGCSRPALNFRRGPQPATQPAAAGADELSG